MKRLTVRSKYGYGHQVVDGSTILSTFDGWRAAFAEVMRRRARVHLTWSRTLVGGIEQPRDFSARFQDERMGRIYQHKGGPADGQWSWFLQAVDGTRFGSTSGTVGTKDEAVEAIEREATRFFGAPER